MIFRNAFISLGGTDLSAYLQSVDPSFDVELTDDTAMGDTARSNAPGLEVWSFSIKLLNPFAASGPDATIWPLKGTTFTVTFRPDTAAVSATNPQFSGTGTVGSWQPIGGSVGDEGVATLEIASAGAITRTTS